MSRLLYKIIHFMKQKTFRENNLLGESKYNIHLIHVVMISI
jgi:hypothetical protein